jgi:transmembrane sensor
MHDQTSHNSLWFLMARSLSGEATALEEEQLRQILQQDVSLQQQYDLMKRMWHGVESQQQTTNSNEEEKQNVSRILKLAKTETQPGDEIPVIQIRSKRKYLYAFSGVASVLVVVAAGWLYFGTSQERNSSNNNPLTQTLVAENGSRTRTILPDGSTVWLNAGSHISFNDDFTGKTREVTLDGEAYFDVVKQPARPFIVHVSGYDIRVLGTAFNVKSYAEDKTIETTLIRGLVQVTKQGIKEQKPIILQPNEKLTVEKLAADNATKLPDINTRTANQDNTGFKITLLNTPLHEEERIETAWIYNRLQFHGDSFTELAEKLERWYNVRIIFDDEHVQQLNFTGSFEQETVEQAFAALKTAQAFNYEIEGKEIHVRSVK